jgi:hypothetical protein
MLLGHWGTTPGQNFIYAHLNRVIKQYGPNMIHVSGPAHGGPAVVGNAYLDGIYSEVYPNISRDEAGLQILFKPFWFPGGIPTPRRSAWARSASAANWASGSGRERHEANAVKPKHMGMTTGIQHVTKRAAQLKTGGFKNGTQDRPEQGARTQARCER